MNAAVTKKLLEMADGSEGISQESEFNQWSARVKEFLATGIGLDEANHFATLFAVWWPETLGLRRGYLEGLVASAAVPSQSEETNSTSAPEPSEHSRQSDSRKVFVVHGRDNAAKDAVARFFQKVGLQPIILHEQPSGGRTIIEKFETYSDDVAFAVVLLTPDDIGSEAGGASPPKPRARQNVIMELGYFIGRLGRTRVCALHKGDVELPSDYQGVVYVEMDSAGAWRAKVAQELVQSRISIDLTGLLGG